jgi:hypothetical protein
LTTSDERTIGKAILGERRERERFKWERRRRDSGLL